MHKQMAGVFAIVVVLTALALQPGIVALARAAEVRAAHSVPSLDYHSRSQAANPSAPDAESGARGVRRAGVMPTPALPAKAGAAVAAAPTPTPAPPTPISTATQESPPTPTLSAAPSPTPTPMLSAWTRPTDRAVMVMVPAGEFLMGSPDRKGDYDERPQHSVTLDNFWIDSTEVTNRQFDQFAQQTGYRSVPENTGSSRVCQGPYGMCEEVDGADWRHPDGPDSEISDRMDHPVVQVTRTDAIAYCGWAGVVLPTEAEWEKAARGTDGRIYPWGDDFDGSRLNFCDSNCPIELKDSEADDGYAGTAPVGSYPNGASPYGAFDMAGNVWEWVADWYADNYYSASATSDPLGPDAGGQREVRGGSAFDPSDMVRSANRFPEYPDYSDNMTGFRCVAAASPQAVVPTTSTVVAGTATPVATIAAPVPPTPALVAPTPTSALPIPTPTATPTAVTYSIAFSRWDGSKHDMYIANQDGGDETLLLGSAAGPSWSPDGQYLAFFGEAGITNQILNGVERRFEGIGDGIISLDMTASSVDSTRLTLHQYVEEGDARWAAWSPDGKMIAFDARRGGPDWHIYILNLPNSKEVASIPGEQADWSPDSSRLVYRSGRNNQQGIWVSNRDDSNPVQITKDSSDSFPRWSSDGKQVAFHRDSGDNVDIYVITVKDGTIRRLTDAAGIDTLPTWTPDGRIVFRSTRSGSWGIYFMNADGSGEAEIIANADPGPDYAFGRMDAR
jgi:formylglycine-generating enzyme required for sulfatase activity